MNAAEGNHVDPSILSIVLDSPPEFEIAGGCGGGVLIEIRGHLVGLGVSHIGLPKQLLLGV